jgi:hypothetical protein|tara:strand:+ start:1583 stop:1966 length:384 start_codon:yes stop_codon:yes gene_type:complete
MFGKSWMEHPDEVERQHLKDAKLRADLDRIYLENNPIMGVDPTLVLREDLQAIIDAKPGSVIRVTGEPIDTFAGLVHQSIGVSDPPEPVKAEPSGIVETVALGALGAATAVEVSKKPITRRNLFGRK